MPQSVNEDLFDEIIRHQVYIERFKHKKLTSLQKFLQELRTDVLAQLTARGPSDKDETFTRTRLEALLKELEAISDRIAVKMLGDMEQELKALAQYEAAWMASTMNTAIPVTVGVLTPAPVQVWAAVTARPFSGRLLKDWVADYTVAQRKNLTNAVRMAVTEGQTIDQLVRRIVGTRKNGYKDGVIDISRRGAEALARTAVNHTVTLARQETFAENKNILKGVQWKATLDGRTSELCRARDGTVYPVDSGPRPPAHPNCRSTIIPVTKSWKELGIDAKDVPPGTRASMDGQVSADTTYNEWLKRQPVGFQDDVLGPTKGKLFRDGGLSMDKFVDENLGRGLTLDELRKRHPEAFKAAGV